jgi:hypothetical protein
MTSPQPSPDGALFSEMKPIGYGDGISWNDLLELADLPKTISTVKNDLAASKKRQRDTLDFWAEQAKLKGKPTRVKKERPLIKPAVTAAPANAKPTPQPDYTPPPSQQAGSYQPSLGLL